MRLLAASENPLSPQARGCRQVSGLCGLLTEDFIYLPHKALHRVTQNMAAVFFQSKDRDREIYIRGGGGGIHTQRKEVF